MGLYREYCPRIPHRSRKLGRYVDVGRYTLIQILKKALLYYYRPNFVYYCVCAFERTFDRTSSSSWDSASLILLSGNSEQKLILHAIEQLIQFIVLDIHFRSLKYTAVIRISKNLSNFRFLSKRYNAITVCWCKRATSNSFQTCL